MMMYIRSTCKEDINGFKFKDKSIKDRMLTFSYMSDMRAEVDKRSNINENDENYNKK